MGADLRYRWGSSTRPPWMSRAAQGESANSASGARPGTKCLACSAVSEFTAIIVATLLELLLPCSAKSRACSAAKARRPRVGRCMTLDGRAEQSRCMPGALSPSGYNAAAYMACDRKELCRPACVSRQAA